MKVLLIAIGTRGDIEPFLAIGEMLNKQGHEVVCQFPAQFKDLTLNSNLHFEGLTAEFLDMINSQDGKMVMGGGGSVRKKIMALYRVYKKSIGINNTMMQEQHELVQSLSPDRILYSSKATYAVVWEVLNPNKSINISPIPYLIHAVNNHGHIGFNANYGKLINRFTFRFTNYFLTRNIVNSSQEIRAQLGITANALKKVLLKKKMVYTISPTFYKQRSYWPDNVKVLGYHEREETSNWKPSQELEDFVDRHERILFVTFGSMTNPKPEHITRMILKILRRNEIPAIINIAGGGLVEPATHNSDLFHFVSHVPYEWVLPKMHAIMHHGGSGTTHLAVKYGCSSLIIPHIMDQHIWNDLNVKLGIGPEGISIGKLNISVLSLLIFDVFFVSRYKSKSQELALKMKAENYQQELLDFVLN